MYVAVLQALKHRHQEKAVRQSASPSLVCRLRRERVEMFVDGMATGCMMKISTLSPREC